MYLVNCLVSGFQKTGSYCVKIVLQSIECNDYCNHIPHILVWNHCNAETFAKVIDLCKNLHDWLIIFLRLVYLWVVEECLKNQVYDSLAYFTAFEFLSYLFWVLQFNDIEGNLIAHSFCNDALGYTHCHLIFFDFFYLLLGILALRVRTGYN